MDCLLMAGWGCRWAMAIGGWAIVVVRAYTLWQLMSVGTGRAQGMYIS